jgi:SWI/SNF-related matrix-associated actin-dependent regulator of chromatin subfamily D
MNPQKSNIGVSSSPFGNSLPPNPTAHILQSGHSQSLQQQQLQQLQQLQQQQQHHQHQQQFGSGGGFPNQFPLSQFSAAHAQAVAQAQSKAAQTHAQVAHAQFQAQLQAQAHAHAQSGVLNMGGSPASASSVALGGNPNFNLMKRFPQKPLGRPPAFANSNMVSSPPLRTMELSPAAAAAARRKKQKLPEKQLQERVASLLPESALYTQLLEFESRIDAALARKKADLQDAIKKPPCIQKTLRIYVFNTFTNQIRSIPKKPNAEAPTWTFKIVGRILEDGVDPDQLAAQAPNPLYPKFSSFFKRVAISLDQRLYPENHLIVWDSARSPAPHDGFEVKRKGDKEFSVNIRLEMNYTPEKFKLSSALMEVLGIEVDTRTRITAAIWHYVKARKLQNPHDPSYFSCDPPLQKVFGEEKMKFTMVSQKISPHLMPPQPIHLEHTIKISGNSPAGNACYDVMVDVPFPIQRELNACLGNAEKIKEIEGCDEAICGAIRKIHEHRKRRAFFLGFSQSPVDFINALIESQGRDLKLVAGDTSRNAEKERTADFYSQPWVEDAVIRYLNRKPVTDSTPLPPPPAPNS